MLDLAFWQQSFVFMFVLVVFSALYFFFSFICYLFLRYISFALFLGL